MADSYLAIASIAANRYMTERVTSAVTQQMHAGSVPAITDAVTWTAANRYLWASSPGWGDKWDSATLSHALTPVYDPGADVSVITDGDILATVQALGAAAE